MPVLSAKATCTDQKPHRSPEKCTLSPQFTASCKKTLGLLLTMKLCCTIAHVQKGRKTRQAPETGISDITKGQNAELLILAQIFWRVIKQNKRSKSFPVMGS